MLRVRESVHAFGGNPIVASKRDSEELFAWLNTPEAASKAKVLPLCDGKPLVSTNLGMPWRLAWQALDEIRFYEPEDRNSQLVYLGDGAGVSCFAVEAPPGEDSEGRVEALKRVAEVFGQPGLAFWDVRSLMQASEYGEGEIMGELSIAGHARAMLEWHKQALYCGRCGSSTRPILCGQRRQCTNVKCNHKLYPRIDPVVIMLVIDEERDCVILGRQARLVPRMWSCLAGFIETFDIRVDKKELQDAKWHGREDVRKMLQNGRYKHDQKQAIAKLHKAASSNSSAPQPQQEQALSDAMGFTSELAFVPGPYAIAHHLITTWANQGLGQSNI